ncbi:hypothetical protein UFOVP457_45 [uncultured Caudovirales phage]|uniref:Uncharacterized protein n=1 Tax=uncultured Caudovirales phage TaxID=2100421 RepID=A0A6J5MCS8_9CAUD|nr:hypothetical protein UFOVP457_45 [uncultured Caudovirales phage]
MTKTTIVEIFFNDLISDFPELKNEDGNLIEDKDKLLEVAEKLNDDKILQSNIELTKYLHNMYHRFDSIHLPEYIENGEDLKIIDSDYFGELEGIALIIEYSVSGRKNVKNLG